MYARSSVPKSTCNTSFNFASIRTCVRGLYLRYIRRNASPLLESCTACTMRSATSSVSISRIRHTCRETWICSGSQRVVSIVPCAGSSTAVTKSGYLSPLRVVYSRNLQYHSCHRDSSQRKTDGSPNLVSSKFVVGCGKAAPAAAHGTCWSLWTCAVNSPILRWSSTVASPIHFTVVVFHARRCELCRSCLPRETLCRSRSATQGFVVLQRTSSVYRVD